jgi:hypothetical protein
MTDEEVVAAALSDPDAQPLTPKQLARIRRVSRVKVLRRRLGMTRAEFAEAFSCPSRHCEIGAAPQHARCASSRAVVGNRTRSGSDAAIACGQGGVESAVSLFRGAIVLVIPARTESGQQSRVPIVE